MSDNQKIQDTHRQRCAYVYIRQSSATQVLVNRESTQRQYQLSERAVQLGWTKAQVKIIDEDLAHSGSGVVTRHGFAQMTHEVAMGQVGIILCLEASRIARNNAEWYRLLELCGVTDTLIGDLDGLYHPGLFNDRLLLGLKGTMAEAELHVLRMRLNGAIRNKAKRGELRRGLPVGLLWGQGEVIFHPDQAVVAAIRSIFEKFAEQGSARRVWLWFQSEGLWFPHERPNGEILWIKPTYIAIHAVLSHPAYAGAYAYGKSRCERYVDESGRVRKRVRLLPQDQWAVLIPHHHPGFIDWATFEMNQARLAKNAPPPPRAANGAVREVRRCSRGWPRVAGVAATCGFTTKAKTPRPVIIANRVRPPLAAAFGACDWAERGLTGRWSKPFWTRSLPPGWRPRSSRRVMAKNKTRQRSNSSVCRSSELVTKPSAPNDVIVRSNLRTVSLPAPSKRSGRTNSTSYSPSKPPPINSASRPRHCFAGSTTDLSVASKSHLALPSAFA
jgi:DNA invertase Pin-like site-specific DNA recombinase